jgi:hypothetical protein
MNSGKRGHRDEKYKCIDVARHLLSIPTDFSYVGSCKVGVSLPYSCKEAYGYLSIPNFLEAPLLEERRGVFLIK